MIYLALDPGKTTGWARWDPTEEKVPRAGQDTFEHMCTRLGDWAHESPQLIVEKFTITPLTSRQPHSASAIEMIGVAKFFAYDYGLDDIVFQTPGDAMSFMTDARLKHLGWWQKGLVHANDALRHLGLYAVKQKLIDPKRLV